MGVESRLRQLDCAAMTDRRAFEPDTRDYPLDAPADTPAGLREAFEAVAHSLFEAVDFRRNPGSGLVFGELARGLSGRFRRAEENYRRVEGELQAVSDPSGCAHAEAITAVREVNDAAGHVMLGSVAAAHAVAHVQAVPAPEVAGLLRRMRQQVSRATQARRLIPSLPSPTPAVVAAGGSAAFSGADAGRGESPSAGRRSKREGTGARGVKTGRPPDETKRRVVEYVRDLRDKKTPWKVIPNAVFKKFKVRYTGETLRGYLKND